MQVEDQNIEKRKGYADLMYIEYGIPPLSNENVEFVRRIVVYKF